MVAAHGGLDISDAQLATWVGHMLDAADEVGLAMPERRGLERYVEQASRFAMNGSHGSI